MKTKEKFVFSLKQIKKEMLLMMKKSQEIDFEMRKHPNEKQQNKVG